MKNFLKLLAAMMVIAMPFALTACSSDDDEDDDKGKTYEYEWTLSNTSLSSGATTDQKMQALEAETQVNQMLALAFTTQGFVVDVTDQEFSVSDTQEAVSIFDNKVKSAIYSVKGSSNYSTIVAVLPDEAKLTVKRGSTKVFDDKLK
ncbi:MAG: hypothetical protein K6C30_08655 [Bacteroidaceae bacterium]|nr:hypothetical protein [Bacteroidaceae bacterium]